MRGRVSLPGVQQIADAVLAVTPRRRSDGRVRLRDGDGQVLHMLPRGAGVPRGTRVLVWRGRAFVHWQDDDWYEVQMMQVREG